MTRTFRMLIVAAALMLSMLLGALLPLVVRRAEGASLERVTRPPRVIVLPCAMAGYPAGWGPGCTVHRPISTSPLRQRMTLR